MLKTMQFRPTLLAACILTLGTPAIAATISSADYNQLAKRVDQLGSVPVVVHLAPVSLTELNKNLPRVKKAMVQKASTLLAMLGEEALSAGRWENGIGQIGFYTTAKGLKLLKNSTLANAFYPGTEWYGQTHLGNADGSLTQLDALVRKQGVVDVVVTLNLDALSYSIDDKNVLRFQSSPAMASDFAGKADALLKLLPDTVAGKAELAQQVRLSQTGSFMADTGSQVTLRVGREELIKLANHASVRKLTPVGFVDQRSRSIDPDIAASLKKDGKARVIITMRNPLFAGQLSKAAWQSSQESNQRTLVAISNGLQLSSRMEMVPEFGVMAGEISQKNWEKLNSTADARILSVQLDRPMPLNLATSTATMNMPHIWSLGYRAAGQNIVVLDSGVEKTHPFFRNAAGTTRVVNEACFGTTATVNGVSYQSVCPGADANGDSLGAGTAAPVPNCSTEAPAQCDHGTHVAGIAAGRNGPGIPAGMQGVAPDANLIPVQIGSYDVARVKQPTVFLGDQIRALQVLAGAVTQGTTNNPYVVNMSLGGGINSAPCNNSSPAMADAVITLKNLGIPVVASNGNAGADTGIGFPACLPGAIKVSSESNDGVGGRRSSFTNLVNPANFPGEFIWVAPGGNVSPTNNYINSSVTAGRIAGMRGTSQAVPHVTGVYAALKAAVPGISVNDASNWILNNGSQAMNVTLAGNTVTVRRLRLP